MFQRRTQGAETTIAGRRVLTRASIIATEIEELLARRKDEQLGERGKVVTVRCAAHRAVTEGCVLAWSRQSQVERPANCFAASWRRIPPSVSTVNRRGIGRRVRAIALGQIASRGARP